MLLNIKIDEIIKNALAEDINYLDIAADYIFDKNAKTTAKFIAKDDGILCGIDIALRVFELLDSDVSHTKFKNDGDSIKKGDIIAELTGRTHILLKGERTTLNFMCHMSGVATMTNNAVQLLGSTKTVIADTRKTLPGLRYLQKYAVITGGGKNHRYNLSDAAMIKDNHIDAAGSITAAITKLKQKIGHMTKIEVETRTLDEVKEAIAAKADVIMLDNMTIEQMKEAVDLINGRLVIEASGNITAENIRKIAETGVDVISMGAITHSVKAFDISMVIA